MNFRNEDLHWFSGKRTFIEGDVYICFKGGVGSRVISAVSMWFYISLWTPNVLFVSGVSNDSGGKELVRFIKPRQLQQ